MYSLKSQFPKVARKKGWCTRSSSVCDSYIKLPKHIAKLLNMRFFEILIVPFFLLLIDLDLDLFVVLRRVQQPGSYCDG